MIKHFYRLFVAMSAVLCASACMDLNIDVKEFTKNSPFAQKVGGIDEQQTWNLAQRSSVTVKTSAPSTIKIFAYDGATTKLAAEKKVSGSEQINFDGIAGLKEVTVVNMNGGTFQNVKIGGVADFTGTKTTYSGNTTVKAELLDTYKEFTYNTVKSDVNTSAFTDIKYASGLYYSESGTFTLNPCWYTNESGQSAVVGVYYYDANGQKVDVKVFKNDKQEDMLQYHDKNDLLYYTYWDAHMPSLGGYDNFAKDTFRSKGIKITVPAKSLIGFYIEGGYDDSGVISYSESKYNQVPSWGYNENPGPAGGKHWIGDDLSKYGHVAMINIEGRKYLAFDDWYEGNNHQYYTPEYYHLVFSLEGDLTDQIGGGDPENPETPDTPGEGGGKIDEEPMSWILACEDLGDDCDYDFNDVVLKISHVDGSTEATVTLLACGGTIRNRIYYNDANGVQQLLGEVHEMFGVDEPDMVNTIPGSKFNRAPVSRKISVPENFAMSQTDMGGFVLKRGTNGVTGQIAAPAAGSSPYLICIPSVWKWPIESRSIITVYPQFSGWCNNHNNNLEWYKTYVESSVYSE